MRRFEGVEVQKGPLAVLIGACIAVVVLMFVVPALGWLLFALGVLWAAVTIHPGKRPDRNKKPG